MSVRAREQTGSSSAELTERKMSGVVTAREVFRVKGRLDFLSFFLLTWERLESV